MKCKIIVFTMTAALLLAESAQAQKKDISQARTYIKSGKDLDKAEKLMTNLLAKDSLSRHNRKVWKTWYDAVMAQYVAGNEKLYLHQKYDTVAFFGLTRRLYTIAESLDSLTARPDKKGRVRPEYRKEHAAALDQLRPNLYFGGIFLMRQGKYEEAFDYFDCYLDADCQPLFSGYDYAANDSLMTDAAYWATTCGYRMLDAPRTLKYAQAALGDKEKRPFTLQYLCEAYSMLENDSAYEATLVEGFRDYPEFPYFFPRLADRYKDKGRNADVLRIANQGLESNDKNLLFMLAKAIALLNMERYDDCIAVSRQMIALNDTIVEPYFNIATCYLNQALVLEEQNEPRKNHSRLQYLYREARPYMERYRQLAANDKQRWAPALYRIYLNLNMGKEFEEIDRLMR